jgi:DhnA family fructose-bisphosphate aldolase class Ia
MDDRFTAFTTRRMLVLGMDGGKFMIRIDPTDRGSLTTIDGCVRAIGELAESSLLSFLEPLPVVRDNGAYRVVRTARALTEAVSVASAWGASSLYTWLKVPTCPEFEKVARATTLPLVLLGGEAVGDPRPVLEDLARGMAAGANVRGAMIGRNVLYPGADDPRAIAAAVAAIVHEGAGVDDALVAMETERGKEPQLA